MSERASFLTIRVLLWYCLSPIQKGVFVANWTIQEIVIICITVVPGGPQCVKCYRKSTPMCLQFDQAANVGGLNSWSDQGRREEGRGHENTLLHRSESKKMLQSLLAIY